MKKELFAVLVLFFALATGCAAQSGGMSSFGRAACYSVATASGAAIGVGTDIAIHDAADGKVRPGEAAAFGGVGALVGAGLCYGLDELTKPVEKPIEPPKTRKLVFRCRGFGCEKLLSKAGEESKIGEKK